MTEFIFCVIWYTIYIPEISANESMTSRDRQEYLSDVDLTEYIQLLEML